MRYKDEVWKLIPGTENVRVSNYGKIKRGRKLARLSPDKEGYLRVTINGKQYRVHRLVAEAFVDNPNPEEYTDVDHINNVHDCNVWTNLRWCTHQQNTKWAADSGLLSGGRKTTVIAIDKDNNGFIYNSQAECAAAIGAAPKSVSKCSVGKLPTIKGYKIFNIKLIDTRFDTEVDEKDLKMGTTAIGGSWVEMKKNGYTLKLIDESTKPDTIKQTKSKCEKILDNLGG